MSFLTPPGGGAAALALYASPAPAVVYVPLYDISGSTIELVNVTNGNTPTTSYYYDPGGEVTTSNNNQRTPWPFLYHGLEQEYPDTWKLYWEPGGNVYNPDPFQLSLSGPQGLGGGGGAFPRAVRGPGANPQVNLGADIYDMVINSINAFGGVNIGGSEGSNFPLDPYLNPFDWFSGGKPEIAWYITTHKSRGAHDVYCGVQGICDAIVTQQGVQLVGEFKELTQAAEVVGERLEGDPDGPPSAFLQWLFGEQSGIGVGEYAGESIPRGQPPEILRLLKEPKLIEWVRQQAVIHVVQPTQERNPAISFRTINHHPR